MPVIARASKFIDHFVEYLEAVVKHVYLLLTGVVLTLAPLIEQRIFKTKAAQVDWRLFIDSYSQPIGLFALFLATFRAWNEEREARETAEKSSPEGLKAQIAELAQELKETKAQQRRVLSPQQRTKLKVAIEAVQANNIADFRFPICHNYLVVEARDYAGQLAEVLMPCGICGVPNSTDEVPIDFQGLALWVKDENTPPMRARHFKNALQEAGIYARFETLTGRRAPHISDAHCEFVVGRQENIVEIEARVARLQADEAHIAAMHWRRLSGEQKTALSKTLIEIGPHTIRLVSNYEADSIELATDLHNVLMSSGWTVNRSARREEHAKADDWNLSHMSGVRILTKYPEGTKAGSELMQAFISVMKVSISFIAGMALDDDADMVLLIGPKGSRL